MKDIGKTLLDILVQSKLVASDFDSVLADVRAGLSAEEMDRAISELDLSPEEERAVRKVCKNGYVFAPELQQDNADEDEDYPNTPQEKLSYAKHVTIKSLENISKALIRFDRLCNLSKLDAPDIIIHNECKMTLQALCPAWADLDEARMYVKEIYNTTSGREGS